MDYLRVVIILGAVLALVGIYMLALFLNRKTKAPEGCELAHLEATCGGCLSKTCEVRIEEGTTT